MICAVIAVSQAEDGERGGRFLKEEAQSQEQSPKVQLGIDPSEEWRADGGSMSGPGDCEELEVVRTPPVCRGVVRGEGYWVAKSPIQAC